MKATTCIGRKVGAPNLAGNWKQRTRATREWLAGSSAGLRFALICILGVGFGVSAWGQAFDAGSNGSLGDVVISENTTLDLPDDGVLHFRTLTVNSGVRLRFNPNVRNTPVTVLSQGDILVEGTIDVNGFPGTSNAGGRGGPGGFAGGTPGFGVDFPAGDGLGPGGGPGGTFGGCDPNNPAAVAGGSFGTRHNSLRPRPVYGSGLLIPIIGGSGGGGAPGFPGVGGGGGGGAILLASNTRVRVAGRVEARGGTTTGGCNFGGGSGGAIRIVAMKVEGNGVITADRGAGTAGQGRIRVDTVDRSDVAFTFTGPTTMGSNLVAIPPVMPRLSTVEAAGNVVPQGQGPVSFILPFGSSPERTIKLRAEDFNRVVSVRIAVSPESGNTLFVDGDIDNLSSNPAEVELPVTLPVNTMVTIMAWTIPSED